jgi:hypothetical protein
MGSGGGSGLLQAGNTMAKAIVAANRPHWEQNKMDFMGMSSQTKCVNDQPVTNSNQAWRSDATFPSKPLQPGCFAALLRQPKKSSAP